MPTLPGSEWPGIDWSGTLEELAELANTLLPEVLPDTGGKLGRRKPGRGSEDVNPRLIRHYTTTGLIGLPGRQGREARYDRLHLLQLLALRRLMADGYSAQALQDLLPGRSEAELIALLSGEARLDVQYAAPSPPPGNPALEYLATLRSRAASPVQLSPAPASPTPVSPTLASPVTPGPAFNALRPLGIRPLPEPAPAQPTERYTRLMLDSGLELHVASSARLPRTGAEHQRLARLLQDALDALRDTPSPPYPTRRKP
jgi:DNA-binding transcriptional MerR regulator